MFHHAQALVPMALADATEISAHLAFPSWNVATIHTTCIIKVGHSLQSKVLGEFQRVPIVKSIATFVWNGIWATGFGLIAALLVFNSAHSLSVNLRQSTSAPVTTTAATSAVPGFTMIVAPTGLDTSTRTLHIIMRLRFSADVRPRLVDDQRNPQSVVDCIHQPQCKLLPGNSDRPVVMEILAATGERLVKSISLGYFFESDPDGALHEEWAESGDIKLTGAPELYPDDNYDFRVYLQGYIPGYHLSQPDQYEATYRFLSGNLPGLIYGSTQGGGKGGLEFHGSIRRDSQTVTYVYLLSAVPLALALLFFHLLFINPTTRGAPLSDLLVGLVASTFAILPVRAVLVPANIQGITRTDYLLGLGLVLLISLAIMKYAVLLMVGRANPKT